METSAAEDNEVLVQVRAASVNALDWRKVRGAPFAVRFVEGLTKPKRPRLGVDFAGVVEAQGRGATEFHPGDEVFGIAYGAFGEYVSAAEREIVLKPANVSFEAAAAVPIAGVTALQGLRDIGQVRAGDSVLVNGAGGGVGTFAVQIAKALGAEVTAVSSTGNLELLRSIGADHVLDYTREDFAAGGPRFDRILDMHPTHSVSAFKRALNPDGICVTIGFGGMLGLMAVALRGKMASKTHGKRIRFFVAKPNKKDLGVLKEFLEAGKIRPVIDRRYPLAEVPAAIRYVEEGHARGKVIILPHPST
ncbi:MAG: NAD(P)-dependent alcohol dehydrogenase [Thermoplasmata archaeon]|nr:NAD(P)-dependent alcohol dehydrogenase [Thermoplasmata archaeon]